MADERLKEYVNEKGIKVNFLEFPEPVLSVEEAVQQSGHSPEGIAKSLIFLDEKTTPILVVIPGSKRVKEEKISRIHGSKVRLAKPQEVEEHTGYEVGGIPPVGLGLKTFVDRKVMNFDSVIAGGGSARTLIEIAPEDIVKANGADIADLVD